MLTYLDETHGVRVLLVQLERQKLAVQFLLDVQPEAVLPGEAHHVTSASITSRQRPVTSQKSGRLRTGPARERHAAA